MKFMCLLRGHKPRVYRASGWLAGKKIAPVKMCERCRKVLD